MSDSEWASVVFVSNFIGTDGDTSATDESQNGDDSPHTMTFVGTCHLEDDETLFGNTVVDFSTRQTGDYITCAASDDWDLGSGAFTVEFWYRSGGTGTQFHMLGPYVNGAGNRAWEIGRGSVSGLTFRYSTDGSTPVDVTGSTGTWVAGWYHICAQRDDDDNFVLFVDGSPVATADLSGVTIYDAGQLLGYGARPGASSNQDRVSGYGGPMRITKGAARYDNAGFTPPADTFEIGSGGSTYPFVEALVTIAAEVAARLPGVDISYAADWSEWNNHRPDDGSGDVAFNLDPLWSSADIAFIGVDNYLPLSDWRAGVDHTDYEDGYRSIYDLDYLQANIVGGEYYDWFYADYAARVAQTRTPITDGAYSKPWVFRQKDFENWWLNSHYNRPGGVEDGTPTDWTAQSKKIVFSELGCPAVDKGSNQPNVFVDPKSSESALPYFSTGARDDQMQRAYLIATLDWWRNNNPGSGGVYTPTPWDTVWTRIGGGGGDFLGPAQLGDSIYHVATPYVFQVGNYSYPAGWVFSAYRNGNDGHVDGIDIAIVRNSYKLSEFPAGETACFAETGVGQYVIVEFEDDPGRWYRFQITALGTIQQIGIGKQAIYHVTAEYVDESSALVPPIETGGMIDTDQLYLWTWDSRPYPTFPDKVDVWSDAPNWRLGHWLTGRAGYSAVSDVVQNILGDLPAEFGFTVETAGLNASMIGYARTATESARDTLAPLGACFFFDGFESGGTIKFESRAKEVAGTYDMDAIVANGNRDFTITTKQATEVPRELVMKFISPEADYQSASVYSRRLVGSSVKTAGAQFNISLPYDDAQGIADAMLLEQHIGRDMVATTLPPSALALDAGDLITLEFDRDFTIQIADIGYGPDRALRGTTHDVGVYDLTVGPTVSRVKGRQTPPGVVAAAFLDLPLLLGDSTAQDFNIRLAASGDPWVGGAFYRGGSLDTNLGVASCIGATASTLPAGPLFRWDRVTQLDVTVPDGFTLASATELEVLNGANLAAVQTIPGVAGSWELFQFATATLQSANTYRLTDLLRGQRGTDAAMVESLAAGALFVLVNPDLQPYSQLPNAFVGVDQTWEYGPSTLPTSSDLFTSTTFATAGVGRRPFEPVHLVAAWQDNGDIELTWVRRSRVDGDSWVVEEIPLGEDSEEYRLEITQPGSPATVVRSASPTATAFTYTAAMQTTDFGSPVTSLSWQVAQWNGSWGAGPYGEKESTQ